MSKTERTCTDTIPLADMTISHWLFVLCFFLAARSVNAQEGSPLKWDGDHFVYHEDSKGNRIPDFSFAGYRNGEAIPDVPVRIVVTPEDGDDTYNIQAAIDYVSSLPPDKNGFRGVVLLTGGTFNISGSLLIQTSGVVLRGSGMDENGTVLMGDGKNRETLIRITGTNDKVIGDNIPIISNYVPVNATAIKVGSSQGFKAGDKIIIERPATAKWIDTLRMKDFGGETGWLGWKPGERNIAWDRTVTAVNGNNITIDIPLTMAIDPKFGTATVATYTWSGRINNVGIEAIRCVSVVDKNKSKDEEHPWMGVTLENVTNAWVRQLTFEHFAGSAVAAYETASKITVEDCLSLKPVSEIGGQRRYTFFTSGQQTLFQRLYSEEGYHDFAAGFMAAGPNAFVQCRSDRSYSFSGPIDSWATGLLLDVVYIDGQALGFQNRRQDEQGAGWTAANSVLWQCSASKILCDAPPAAINSAFGCWGEFDGYGYWENANSHINPRSLYYAQLQDRLGKKVMDYAFLMEVETEASSSPSPEVAQQLMERSVQPAPTLKEFIEKAPERNPISHNASGIQNIKQVVKSAKNVPGPVAKSTLLIKNGWLMDQGGVFHGKRQGVRWWRGNIRTDKGNEITAHITRFVPGRVGKGFTDDFEQVSEEMKANGVGVLEHNYGLWYDRRRDDHERIRRQDGEVWAPFYELPFARSGEGLAWDGLSKYDLTSYNSWYWNRLKKFAQLADVKGLLLIHQNYFQHNILEAGAHWADFPWRTANNINDTGFPEPPPYAGDKRIFMAEQFYDVSNPVRRALHKAYIRQCLENFKDNKSVIQFIGEEFTGPLHFVQFWLDVIKEWETETGIRPLIGLSVTKDVQDKILADKDRAGVVDIIDIRYWFYRNDSSAYAPLGGQNLAPRQHARLVKPGTTSFNQVYRAVREYKDQYPEKVVMYSADKYDQYGWAAFMAGASVVNLPEMPKEFLIQASNMKPLSVYEDCSHEFVLADEGKNYILYVDDKDVKLDLSKFKGMFSGTWIDPQTGKQLGDVFSIKGAAPLAMTSQSNSDVVLWIQRKK